MGFSLNLGRVFRIPVRVHWTMLLLLAFVSWGGGLAGVGVSLVSLVLLFGSVLAHELAHALAARRFGIGTSEIVLLPIGGMAKIEREPQNGLQEVIIALAGPAMSLLVAGAAGLLALATSSVPFLGAAAAMLAFANLMLGLFNLLPAFPMDGGRVLRGALRGRRGLVGATRIAARLGRILTIPMAIVGFALGSVSLVLVAGFVYLAARAEERMVEARAAQQAFWAGEPSAWQPPRPATDVTGAVVPRQPGVPRRVVVQVGPFGYVVRDVR